MPTENEVTDHEDEQGEGEGDEEGIDPFEALAELETFVGEVTRRRESVLALDPNKVSIKRVLMEVAEALSYVAEGTTRVGEIVGVILDSADDEEEDEEEPGPSPVASPPSPSVALPPDLVARITVRLLEQFALLHSQRESYPGSIPNEVMDDLLNILRSLSVAPEQAMATAMEYRKQILAQQAQQQAAQAAAPQQNQE